MINKLAYKFAAENRTKKWRLFTRIISPDADATVLDVGVSEHEFSRTDNFLEKHYPFPQNITALGIDRLNLFRERYPAVQAVVYEGRNFPFRDKAFDICWSNAVLEHVGDLDSQVLFIREVSRVARIAWITTPNRNFPVEVHTRTPLLHLLPESLFRRYLALIGTREAYSRLLTKRDVLQLLRLAGISSYRVIENKLLCFTLDFIILFGDIGSVKHRLFADDHLGLGPFYWLIRDRVKW